MKSVAAFGSWICNRCSMQVTISAPETIGRPAGWVAMSIEGWPAHLDICHRCKSSFDIWLKEWGGEGEC